MHFRSLLVFLGLGLLACSPLLAAKHKTASASPGGYKGAIVIDAQTGQVLIEDHADIVSPPASVTKLMTFLVVQDRIREGKITLQTPVTANAADARMKGTRVALKQGETFPVDELLYAIMIQSANDAATALAHTAAGSLDAFVQLMNARAKSLGMTNTTFRSPSGYPPSDRKISDSDLTSPRDLAILSREVLRTTNILSYTSLKERPFRASSLNSLTMRNHNHMLGKIAGVDGLKTGFTDSAEFCISVTAQRDGRRIIAVVMGSPDHKTRDLRAGELIEKGFAALPAGSPAFTVATPSTPATPSKASAVSPISAAAPTDTPSPSNDDGEPKITFPGVKKK